MRVEANETIGRRLFYNPILFSRANVLRNFIPPLSQRAGSDCEWNRDKGRCDRHAPDKTFSVSGSPFGKVLHAIRERACLAQLRWPKPSRIYDWAGGYPALQPK